MVAGDSERVRRRHQDRGGPRQASGTTFGYLARGALDGTGPAAPAAFRRRASPSAGARRTRPRTGVGASAFRRRVQYCSLPSTCASRGPRTGIPSSSTGAGRSSSGLLLVICSTLCFGNVARGMPSSRMQRRSSTVAISFPCTVAVATRPLQSYVTVNILIASFPSGGAARYPGRHRLENECDSTPPAYSIGCLRFRKQEVARAGASERWVTARRRERGADVDRWLADGPRNVRSWGADGPLRAARQP